MPRSRASSSFPRALRPRDLFRLAATIGLGGGVHPPAALASLDEFENWSVVARELDDENGLDDLQRSFAPWEDWQWRDYRNGARVGMGCATTEVWELNLQTKIHHALAKRAEVTFDHVQQEELGESVVLSEFGGSWWTAGGIWMGAFYRPSFAKELHSAGLFLGYRESWERRFRLRLGFEDALNNFWDRRTRYIVDKSRRVYQKRPLEWELAGRWRRPGLGQLALRTVWLSEYRRSVTPAPSETLSASVRTSEGWLVFADVVTESGNRKSAGLRARVKGTNRRDIVSTVVDHARLRDAYVRPWLDLAVSRRWRVRGVAQARWSSERHHDGTRDHVLETRHLGGMGTVVWSAFGFLDVETGFGVDRVHVDQDAAPEFEVVTHGTRTEWRAILSVDIHVEGARLVLTETFEGNREGHQTYGFHDKGFARLVIEF
jgi:hypothetical protein